MGLRLAEGISLDTMAQRFGLAADELVDRNRIAPLVSHGVMWDDGVRIGATPAGMVVLDAILGEIVRDDLVAA